MDAIETLKSKLKGRWRENVMLADTNWFGVGGPAEYLFKPADTEDLAAFFTHKPEALPVTVIAVGSNLLVRDGGLDGVVTVSYTHLTLPTKA